MKWRQARNYEQPYDSLVLSTGASPLRPSIPGIGRAGHLTVRNMPDVEPTRSPAQGTVRPAGPWLLVATSASKWPGNLSIEGWM